MINPSMAPELTMFSLAGMTAIVAGASRGIGYALATGLAQAGASVIGFGRSADVCSDHFAYLSCDINDAAGVQELFDGVETSHGKIDVYIHVAGITLPSGSGLQAPDVFTDILNNNLTSAYRCCADVGQRMASRQQGSIITVTSIGSVLAFPNNPGYVAAKGGLRMMSKALALDLGSRNVRVNSLVPGYIHTNMTDASYQDISLHEDRAKRTMLGRWGQVSDLVGAAIFLASSASTYITGIDLMVDGGWTAKGL